MSQGLPTALVLGIDHFVAKSLAQALVSKEIRVIGVGEMVPDLMNLENFTWVMELSELEGKFDYVFDFVGERTDWQKIDGDKLVLIAVDDQSRRNYLAK
mgnify:CR=1 FL=1